MPNSLRARYVFPVDRPPIEDGVVVLQGERILAVGGRDIGDNAVDLGEVALLPGLINAHTHLELSNLRQPLGQPGMLLVDWVRLVISERGRRDYTVDTAIESGLRESLAAGVTSVGDISSVAGQAPPSTQLDLTRFLEVIAFSRARAESAFGALAARLSSQLSASGRVQRAQTDIRLGISPHAPYTVSPELLAKLIALAQHQRLPVAMHIAESREERQLLEHGTGPFQELLDERSMWDAAAITRGSRPLDYLRALAEAPRALAIHGNYLDAAELKFLAERRVNMSLVYCPRTHRFFQHEPYPLAQALAAGVRVAVGTDSRASNPDLSVLAELQFISRQNPTLDPYLILSMGTIDGAEALGRAAEVGSLAPGKLANLVTIALPESRAATPADALGHIFASDARVENVWLNGQPQRSGAERE
ncbi:MAG: amidohydrolase family protein [Pirellulales bacterium]